MKKSEVVGMVSGAIASIVFIAIAFLTNLSYFIAPVILFLCSVLAIGIYELQNRVHICDKCGVKLEPLPTQYKKHTHSKTKD